MIVLVVGPTAVGKTKISISIAKKLNAEVINTDKMAMIKETCIGTAKITESEMEGIKHHFINNISLNDDYSIYDFQIEGRKVLDLLLKENKNVVIVGGSGLYTKALLYYYKLNKEDETKEYYENLSNEELKNMADNIKENKIHKNNRNRLIRFINLSSTGKENLESKGNNKALYDFKVIGLKADREALYKRINDRVDEMITSGLIKEAENLFKKSYKNLSAIIGYKELIPFFKNEILLEEAIENIKKDTRHYAKRQMTWLNHQMDNIKWFNVDFEQFEKVQKEVIDYITSLQ